MTRQKVLVVEDDRKIAAVVKAYLEAAGYAVSIAGTAAAALESFDGDRPSIVLLDLMLPDGSGTELIHDMKATADVPVIMVTARSSEEDRLAGFSLGADDYILKPFSPKELVARVGAVLKRTGGPARPGRQSFSGGSLVIDAERMEVLRDGCAVALSQTEFKLMQVLSSHPGRVFSRLELVEKALGYQFEGYERTVDAHIKNLRHKLGDSPRRPTFIQTVFGAGYRFMGTRDAS